MSEKQFKIGISGSYGGLNLGDEAILQCIIAQLRKELSVEITVFSRNAADTEERHKGVRAVDVRRFSTKEIKPEIARLDLFVLGGGGILYDADAQLYLREATMAKECNVPVMLYAIGVGPLKDPSVRKTIKNVLNEVDLITVREKEAAKVLEEIGVEKEITITADPALMLLPEKLPDKNLQHFEVDPGKKLIGISVREPGVAAPDLDENIYHGLIADAADFIIDRLDGEILFIPMERNEKDLQHSHAVVSRMLRPQKASILKGDYTSGQVLNIIGKLDFALGMRLHFLIFSALQEVPFVALPYASKIVGFLEELGIQTPPLQLVNAGRLIAHIDYYWDKQKELKSLIREKLPALKEKSMLTNKMLINLLTYADADATR